MKTLTEIFAEARKVSTRTFWNAFASQGYAQSELPGAPSELLDYCFKKADAAGWRYLREQGAFEHHEWTFQEETQEGAPE
jgi:hypothetical protein